jgi:hypothetical protein
VENGRLSIGSEAMGGAARCSDLGPGGCAPQVINDCAADADGLVFGQRRSEEVAPLTGRARWLVVRSTSTRRSVRAKRGSRNGLGWRRVHRRTTCLREAATTWFVGLGVRALVVPAFGLRIGPRNGREGFNARRADLFGDVRHALGQAADSQIVLVDQFTLKWSGRGESRPRAQRRLPPSRSYGGPPIRMGELAVRGMMERISRPRYEAWTSRQSM